MKSSGESTTACVPSRHAFLNRYKTCPKVLVATLLRAMFAKREPVERQRRARHVAQNVLESLPIATIYRDLRVHVHAAELRERARL